MADVGNLIRRIDKELATEVTRQKTQMQEAARAVMERAPRLERYDAVAAQVIELLKPRLAAFVDRFKDVVKAEPFVRQHTRVVNLTFSATVAKVTLLFEVFPDENLDQVRLECTQEIIPVIVPYDKQSVYAFPVNALPQEAVTQWFDERIIAFVKNYLEVIRRDAVLREHLKEQFVEDPVSKIRFPSYLAASTLERDGRTYYFVDEDSRREFEKQPAA